MSGGGLGAEIAQSKCEECVVPKAPHIFHTFIVQSRPSDSLRTHLLCKFNIWSLSQCTWGWTTTSLVPALFSVVSLPNRPEQLHSSNLVEYRATSCGRTRTQGQILDFSFFGYLESIHRANFRWVMSRFSSRGRWARSWAQLGRKPTKNRENMRYRF